MKDVDTVKSWLIGAGIIFIVGSTLAAYIPAMHGGYIWDDDLYVTQNPLLSVPDGFLNIWTGKGVRSQYLPMVYTTFRLEYSLWGLRPFGYHLTNIVLHVINALLIWLLLGRLKVRGAWLVSAIFALHPVHAESVAWITELKNVLSLLFCLGSAWAYFKYSFGWGKDLTKGKSERFYQLSIFLFLCALASKAVMCTFPVLLLIIIWWKRGKISRKDFLDIVRFFVLALAWGLFIMWWEHHRIGTGAVEFGFTLSKRILIASHALWFYLGKLILPVYLTFSYPKWHIEPSQPLQYIWLLAWLVVAWSMWHWRVKIRRGPIAAIAFFFVALSPMIGFFSLYTFIYTYVADHYQYMASIGPITLFVAAGYSVVDRWGKCAKVIKIACAIVILATLGTLTWKQCHIYKDMETLWRDTIRKNPQSWMAHNNLGLELKSQGKLDIPVRHFRQSLQIKPDYAYVFFNLGLVLQSQGKLDEAISHFRQSLQIDPNLFDAHNNMGLVLQTQGKVDEAISHFRQALQIATDYPYAHNNLGLVLQSQGNFDEAISHFRQAVQAKPNFDEAQRNLDNLLQSRGKFK